jgi:hypothetical protein
VQIVDAEGAVPEHFTSILVATTITSRALQPKLPDEAIVDAPKYCTRCIRKLEYLADRDSPGRLP